MVAWKNLPIQEHSFTGRGVHWLFPVYFKRDSRQLTKKCQVSSTSSSEPVSVSLPQKAELMGDIGTRVTLSLAFNWVWSIVPPHRKLHECESKVWYSVPGSFPVRWPWAAWVPKPVVAVLLEAAALCDSLQWAWVPAFSLILDTWLWCGGDNSATPYPVPALPLVEPHPPNSHPCKQSPWEGNLLEIF